MALALVFALFTLTSLCYATPPDQTWIAGLYDDADHDDVVLAVLDTIAVPAAVASQVFTPAPVHEAPAAVDRSVPRSLSLIAPLDRSPPLA
jgi:hypothetical protein